MTLYADTSALLKRYVDEPDSDRAEQPLAGDADLVTGRHAVAEVRRNLARLLPATAAANARASFADDIAAFAVVELDAATCELAARSPSRPACARSMPSTSAPLAASARQ